MPKHACQTKNLLQHPQKILYPTPCDAQESASTRVLKMRFATSRAMSSGLDDRSVNGIRVAWSFGNPGSLGHYLPAQLWVVLIGVIFYLMLVVFSIFTFTQYVHHVKDMCAYIYLAPDRYQHHPQDF